MRAAGIVLAGKCPTTPDGQSFYDQGNDTAYRCCSLYTLEVHDMGKAACWQSRWAVMLGTGHSASEECIRVGRQGANGPAKKQKFCAECEASVQEV